MIKEKDLALYEYFYNRTLDNNKPVYATLREEYSYINKNIVELIKGYYNKYNIEFYYEFHDVMHILNRQIHTITLYYKKNNNIIENFSIVEPCVINDVFYTDDFKYFRQILLTVLKLDIGDYTKTALSNQYSFYDYLVELKAELDKQELDKSFKETTTQNQTAENQIEPNYSPKKRGRL